jgi:hypothetical protein
MKRLVAPLILLAGVAPPAGALAGGTISGANHAVVHALREESEAQTFTATAHCRFTGPSRFGCSFVATTLEEGFPCETCPGGVQPPWEFSRTGRVGVTYTHHHYYVGEPRYHHY